MSHPSQDRIWPYLLLTFCFFGACLVVPRYWEWRKEQAMGRTSAPRAEPVAEANIGLSLNAPRLASTRKLDDAQAQYSATGPIGGPDLAALSFDDLRLPDDHPALVEQLEVSPPAGGVRVAPIGPLVANRAFAHDPNNSPASSEEVLPPDSAGDADLPPLRLARRVELPGEIAADNYSPDAETIDPAEFDPNVARWPQPETLIAQLTAIEGGDGTAAWAAEALKSLKALGDVSSIASPDSAVVLARLLDACREGERLALQVKPLQQQTQFRDAVDSLHRRVVVWKQLHTLAEKGELGQFISTTEPDEIRRQIQLALASIPGAKAPPAWKEFLRLGELAAAIDAGPLDSYDRSIFARRVLERMHSRRLNARQKKLISSPEFAQLAASLRLWATEEPPVVRVMHAIERFEQQDSMRAGRELAECAARLRWSNDATSAALAARIDEEYRAANIRIAVTDALLNRLLPQPEATNESVNETMVGTYVTGENSTRSALSVRFIPDDTRWRLGLEARGAMNSDTTSHASRATLYTQGTGRFVARKLFVVDHHNVHVWPAEAEASYQSQLYGLGTQFDNIPLVSRMARNTAMQQYAASRFTVQQEVEGRMRREACQQLDKESHEPLFDAEARLQRQLLEPLRNLAVQPTTMKLHTTEQRLTGQYRLAGLGQLSGHTPRPWAPNDALFSAQFHQSAINNVIAGLKLNGRTADVPTLYRDIRTAFGEKDVKVPENLPEDVRVTFADEEAIRINFIDGHMEIIMNIAELRGEGRRWRDLVVRNYYAPDMSSRQAFLVRDSSVRLKGHRLRIGDQIALRGVFAKIFIDNDRIPLITSDIANQEGVKDLAVTQYVIQNGWIGVAWARPQAAGTVKPLLEQASSPHGSPR